MGKNASTTRTSWNENPANQPLPVGMSARQSDPEFEKTSVVPRCGLLPTQALDLISQDAQSGINASTCGAKKGELLLS